MLVVCFISLSLLHINADNQITESVDIKDSLLYSCL